MEMELRHGQMEPNTQGITRMVVRRVLGSSSGVMELHTLGSSRITISRGKESMFGRIRGSTRGIGITIKCMDLESSLGLMEKSISVIILFLLYTIIIGDYIEDKKEGFG